MAAMKDRLGEMLDILDQMSGQTFEKAQEHLLSLGYSEEEVKAAIKYYIAEGCYVQ